MGLTWRAVAFVLLMLLLLLSYGNSLRVYFKQQSDLAEANQQIASRTVEVARLQDEVKRWKDPDFIKAQARSQLGWVVPGETGYKVIGPDGKPLDNAIQLDTTSDVPDSDKVVWWQKLAGSVQAADQQSPANPSAAPSASQPASSEPTIRPSPTQSSSPTPTRKR